MAAEPRIRPASEIPSSNGRMDCANLEAGRTDFQSVRYAGGAIANGSSTTNNSTWLQSILDQFEGPLVRYAARITGDLERGRDVVQETFLRLCREPAVAKCDHLAQWLFTVCRRLAVDVRRKESRMSMQLESTAVCNEPTELPRSSLEQSEELGQVLRLLTCLPANQQEVVRLKFQEAMSYKQIAAVTGLSASNVGYLLHTAVKALRQELKEQA